MTRLRYPELTGSIGSGGLTSSATSHTFAAPLTYSGGTTVPTLTGSDYFMLSLYDVAAPYPAEIVQVTAYNSTTGAATLVRGQDGSAATPQSSGGHVGATDYPTGLGGAVRDRRWYRGAGEISIDEFNDVSLDAAWTRVDGTGAASGNLTWTEDADALSACNIGGDSTDKFHALMRPLTGAGGSMSAGDAFITCLRLFAPHVSGSITIVGLALADGTSFGSGNQVFTEVADVNASNTYQTFSWTNYGTVGTSGGALPATLPLGLLYLRLVMTAANTWRSDLSIDGVSWLLGPATVAKTMTPTHVGFFDSSYGTSAKHIASWEFLRRVSGVS